MNTGQRLKKGAQAVAPGFQKENETQVNHGTAWGRGGRGKVGFPLPWSPCSWHFASLTHRCLPNISCGYTEDLDNKLVLTRRCWELSHNGEKVSSCPHVLIYVTTYTVFMHKLLPSSLRALINKSGSKCLIKNQLSIIKIYFLISLYDT